MATPRERQIKDAKKDARRAIAALAKVGLASNNIERYEEDLERDVRSKEYRHREN